MGSNRFYGSSQNYYKFQKNFSLILLPFGRGGAARFTAFFMRPWAVSKTLLSFEASQTADLFFNIAPKGSAKNKPRRRKFLRYNGGWTTTVAAILSKKHFGVEAYFLHCAFGAKLKITLWRIKRVFNKAAWKRAEAPTRPKREKTSKTFFLIYGWWGVYIVFWKNFRAKILIRPIKTIRRIHIHHIFKAAIWGMGALNSPLDATKHQPEDQNS